jgi:regulator of sigma E protease
MLLEAFAILIMLAILSILIIVHEFGHFSVAKLFGFQTPVFGFGLPFGPYKVLGHRWGTEFRAYACVLGGFVAIPELGDESNATQDTYGVPLKPFRKFPIWQRALVAFAGVGFNILFAWLIMLIMLMSFGEPTQPVVVSRLPAENPIAAQAGVKAGDRITAIDSTAIEAPEDVVHYLTTRPSTKVIIHVKRKIAPAAGTATPQGAAPPTSTSQEPVYETVDIPVTTNGNGKVGMELVARGTVHYKALHASFPEMVGMATDKLWKLANNMIEALGMMVQGIFSFQHHAPAHTPGAPPKLGFEDLHGVLLVVAVGADIAQQDWSQLFLFTIMISLDLAIINLVPWPALDGFHLAAMGLEAVRGKPLEERAQGEIVRWGFISLLLLMAMIMVNDVRSLMTGEFSLKKKNEQQATPPESAKPPAKTETTAPATDRH